MTQLFVTTTCYLVGKCKMTLRNWVTKVTPYEWFGSLSYVSTFRCPRHDVVLSNNYAWMSVDSFTHIDSSRTRLCAVDGSRGHPGSHRLLHTCPLSAVCIGRLTVHVAASAAILFVFQLDLTDLHLAYLRDFVSFR